MISSPSHRPKSGMTIKGQWSETIFVALVIGVVLSGFASFSMLVEFDLSIWLWIHNSLVVISLFLTFLIGYRLRGNGSSIVSMIAKVAFFYGIVMALYIGSYAVMTYFFSDHLAWIPFFHRDYTYWGFRTVREYMDHKDNFRDLLVLQIISCLICSILYLAAGLAGVLFRAFRLGSNRV